MKSDRAKTKAADLITKPDDALDYTKFFSRSHDVVIRVYDESGNVTETHEHNGDFKEP